jgi:RNA recognition motif-containing protein
VANLPFAVDDAELTNIFKEFNPVSAHVVVKRNGRSKGFGFVEFKTADEQQKALGAVDKKEVQGRALVVRVAQQSDSQAGGDA